MGADFCCGTLLWDRKRRLHWRSGVEVIESLEYDDQGMTEMNSGITFCKEDLECYLSIIEEASKDKRRDATTMDIGHLTLLMTGGTTWGDDPSEVYTAISSLSDCPKDILGAVGFLDECIDYKKILLKVLKNKEIHPLLIGVDKELDKILDKELRRCQT